jgi:hypothetical protein
VRFAVKQCDSNLCAYFIIVSYDAALDAENTSRLDETAEIGTMGARVAPAGSSIESVMSNVAVPNGEEDAVPMTNDMMRTELDDLLGADSDNEERADPITREDSDDGYEEVPEIFRVSSSDSTPMDVELERTSTMNSVEQPDEDLPVFVEPVTDIYKSQNQVANGILRRICQRLTSTDNLADSKRNMRARFKIVNFIILVPKFNSLKQQTKERVVSYANLCRPGQDVSELVYLYPNANTNKEMK